MYSVRAFKALDAFYVCLFADHDVYQYVCVYIHFESKYSPGQSTLLNTNMNTSDVNFNSERLSVRLSVHSALQLFESHVSRCYHRKRIYDAIEVFLISNSYGLGLDVSYRALVDCRCTFPISNICIYFLILYQYLISKHMPRRE